MDHRDTMEPIHGHENPAVIDMCQWVAAQLDGATGFAKIPTNKFAQLNDAEKVIVQDFGSSQAGTALQWYHDSRSADRMFLGTTQAISKVWECRAEAQPGLKYPVLQDLLEASINYRLAPEELDDFGRLMGETMASLKQINAWILYRSYWSKKLGELRQRRSVDTGNVSTKLSTWWKDLTDQEKRPWFELASKRDAETSSNDNNVEQGERPTRKRGAAKRPAENEDQDAEDERPRKRKAAARPRRRADKNTTPTQIPTPTEQPPAAQAQAAPTDAPVAQAASTEVTPEAPVTQPEATQATPPAQAVPTQAEGRLGGQERLRREVAEEVAQLQPLVDFLGAATGYEAQEQDPVDIDQPGADQYQEYPMPYQQVAEYVQEPNGYYEGLYPPQDAPEQAGPVQPYEYPHSVDEVLLDPRLFHNEFNH